MSNTPVRKILILAANPRNTSRLRLDQELRDIAEGLRRAQERDQFVLEQRLAVRPRDIQRSMLDITPQIVHFSGHGEGEEGLVSNSHYGNFARIWLRLLRIFAIDLLEKPMLSFKIS
jgi:hypothetical protein